MKTKLFSVGIEDCRVDTFTVGGNGGSGKDTSNTGVRITHPPSGAVGRAVDSRSQSSNKRLAFRRMAESKAFTLWTKVKAAGFNSVQEQVEAWMEKKNLKVEVRTADGWRDEKDVPETD